MRAHFKMQTGCRLVRIQVVSLEVVNFERPLLVKQLLVELQLRQVDFVHRCDVIIDWIVSISFCDVIIIDRIIVSISSNSRFKTFWLYFCITDFRFDCEIIIAARTEISWRIFQWKLGIVWWIFRCGIIRFDDLIRSFLLVFVFRSGICACIFFFWNSVFNYPKKLKSLIIILTNCI